jgi:hypothetical protein
MEKMIRKIATAYFIQCHNIEIQESKHDDSKTSDIQDLIKKHKKVFQDLPMELLPQRRIEHIIEVKPGSRPFKVIPYRYPHHHKKI